MPTLAQLQAESWWVREIVTPELNWLADELCRRTGRPRVAAGTKGDQNHLRGAHRSQEWILNSRYCTDRRYTVQSGLTAEQARHIAGFDFTPAAWGSATNRKLMVEQTGRLVAALRAGQLSGVLEVIGTLDGKTVYGIAADGTRFSADSSHLDHWHLTFDRRRLRDRALMERVLKVALGINVGVEDDSMFCKYGDGKSGMDFKVWVLQASLAELGFDPGPLDGVYGDKTAAALVKAGLVGGDKTGKTYGAYEHYHLQKRLQETRARKVVESAVAQIRDSLPSGSPSLPTRVVIEGELRMAE